jgi:hypothetical protein
MAIATTTALLIGAGISAGTNIASTAMQNRANTKARDQQQQATNQAQGSLDRVYQQTRGDLAPYMNVGSGAMTSLGQMVGLPQQPAAPQGAQPPSAMGNMAQGLAGVGTGLLGQMGVGTAKDAKGRLPEIVQNVAQARTGSSYVRMRAPNGQMGTVPSDQVPHYQQLGGEVVG